MASMPIGTLNPSLPLADAGGKPDNARIHEVARKLEGQFAQMMIKCMREAGFGDSLFPGENQIFRDMYDQQIATAMSQGRGLGLAPMIARQLGATDAATPTVPAGRGIGSSTHASSGVPDTITLDTITVRPDAACDEVEQVASADPTKYARNTPERFVAEIWGHAQKAAKEAQAFQRAANDKEDTVSTGTLQARGMKITALNPGEQQKVVAALKPVYDKYSETLGKDLVNRLLAAVK